MITMEGKRCTICHEWKPLQEFHKDAKGACGRNARCKACRQELRRVYRQSNLEKARADNRRRNRKYRLAHAERLREENRIRTRRYCELHRDEINERKRRYYQENKEKVQAQCRKWREENEEHKATYHKEYYHEHAEECREASRRWHRDHPHGLREWRRANPDKVREQKRRSRARKVNAPGEGFTDAEFDVLCEQYDSCCLCCGEEIKLTVDHIVPLSQGGHDEISNIQPLCAQCNSRKGVRTIDYRPHNADISLRPAMER